MVYTEGDNRNSPEAEAGYFQEEFRRYLRGLHEVASWGRNASLMTGCSIAEYIAGNTLHNYWRMPRTFILEVFINRATFQRLKNAIPEKPNTLPRIRSEVVQDKERYVVRITPPGGVDEQYEQADETTIQFDTDWNVDGFLIKEVPHPDLPERLKRDFAQAIVSAEEILDITVSPFTPRKRTENTFKTARELLKEQLEETEKLARGFDVLMQMDPSLHQLISETYNNFSKGINKGDEDQGEYPSDEECGIDEKTYWYFESQYHGGEITDPADIELFKRQWEALMRRARIDMKRVNRLRKAKDN